MAQIMAGPTCGLLLADLGAEVIKIEKTPGGDDTRNFLPPDVNGVSAAYLMMNRNKKGIALNLKDKEGIKIFKTMIKNSDVVLENFRKGTLEKLGIGYDTMSKINPKIILCEISGYGRTGPYANKGGFDLVAQGMSGLMSITGEDKDKPPMKVGAPLTDITAGLLAASGILAALIHRDKTGEGQKVDTSLYEAGIVHTYWQSAIASATGVSPGVIGGFFLMLAAYVTARKKNFPVEETFNIPNVKKTAKDAALAFLLPVIILGGIFGGVVTATEGAGLAVVASLVIGFIYKEIDFKRLYESACEGAIQTASVMLLVAASVLLGEFLTIEQIPQKVAESIIEFTNNKYAVLGILNIFLLIIGFFLHSVAAIILTVPIVMPLVNAVGIDPVHFGIIVTLNLAIGQQTPPVASVLVTACSVAKADIWDVTRSNISFICVLLVLLLLVTYVPAIPMTLVEYFYRS